MTPIRTVDPLECATLDRNISRSKTFLKKVGKENGSYNTRDFLSMKIIFISKFQIFAPCDKIFIFWYRMKVNTKAARSEQDIFSQKKITNITEMSSQKRLVRLD